MQLEPARRAITPALVGLAALLGMLGLAYATRHGVGIAPDSVSYLEAARNLVAGLGLSTSEDGVLYRPLTRFPPLYPALIAGIARFGVDPLDAARWLAVALLGANVALVGALVARCEPGARWLPAIGAVLMASSPDMAGIHGSALSEPLFLLLGFSGLLLLSIHLEKRQPRQLLGASLLIALALLTRFVGVALVATGALALLLAPGVRPRRRALGAAAFAGLALLPIAIWTLGNRLGGASAAPRSFAVHPIGGDAMMAAGRTIGNWLLLGTGKAIVPWLVGALLLLCIARWRLAAPARGAADGALPRVLLLFAFVYPALLLVSISFFDASTPLNARILSPLFVAALVLVLCALRAGFSARRGAVPAILAALLAIAFTLAHARDTSQWIRARAAAGGTGFGSLTWRESETMRQLKDLPADAVVYSNARDAIYLLTGRSTRWLPAWADAETRLPRPAYAAELAEVSAALRAQGARLVWFDPVGWRWYLPSRAQLEPILPIHRVTQLRDGEIWSLDPTRAGVAR
jgi:hypothetical protein